VAVVNEAFVRQHLQGRLGVGTLIRVTFGDIGALDRVPRTIIGIAPDVKEKKLYEPAPPTVYIPLMQGDWRVSLRMALVVRSPRTVADLTPAIRGAIAAVDPEQAAYGLMALDDLMESELSLNRLSLFLLGALATIAVVLAVMGVYAVAAHAVGQRTREIGIRLALGVTQRGVVRLLVRDTAAVLAIGMGCGAAATMWSAGLLRSLVPGIERTDAWTFGAAALLLAAAVLAGCYLPARRAARIDPAIVLRMD
jgi:predicted lysophospholipase L1 biosynthesis ABC-type transport system permease subunit